MPLVPICTICTTLGLNPKIVVLKPQPLIPIRTRGMYVMSVCMYSSTYVNTLFPNPNPSHNTNRNPTNPDRKLNPKTPTLTLNTNKPNQNDNFFG